MSLYVEGDALHDAGAQIARATAAPGALTGATVQPAAEDPVSVGVASTLSAHLDGIATRSAQGAHAAASAATVLHANAATYQQQEDLNTAALRPNGAAPAAAPTSPVTALPPPPDAAIPAMPAPAPAGPIDGKTIATLIHGGTGPQPLLDGARLARAHATELRDISTELRAASTRLNQGWQSPAADAALHRINALASWYDTHARHTSAAAQTCDFQAEAFRAARAGIPKPDEFDELERRLVAANRANMASGGRYTAIVTQLQTQLQATHTRAQVGYADYTTRAMDLPTDTPGVDDQIVGPREGPHIQAVDDQTGSPTPTPQPQIGPFPVPPQVAAQAPPGPPAPTDPTGGLLTPWNLPPAAGPIDPTGGLLTPQNLPPAVAPPHIPGIVPFSPPGAPDASGIPENVFTWTPSGSDLATGASGAISGGTLDAVRGTVLNTIAANPGTGPGVADPGLLRWLEDMHGVSRAGGVVAGVTAIPAVFADIHDGNSVAEAVTREAAGTGAGLWAGGIVGGIVADAAAGGAIGSIVPGAGTIVGVVAGAVVGAGAAFGVSKAIDWLWE